MSLMKNGLEDIPRTKFAAAAHAATLEPQVPQCQGPIPESVPVRSSGAYPFNSRGPAGRFRLDVTLELPIAAGGTWPIPSISQTLGLPRTSQSPPLRTFPAHGAPQNRLDRSQSFAPDAEIPRDLKSVEPFIPSVVGFERRIVSDTISPCTLAACERQILSRHRDDHGLLPGGTDRVRESVDK